MIKNVIKTETDEKLQYSIDDTVLAKKASGKFFVLMKGGGMIDPDYHRKSVIESNGNKLKRVTEPVFASYVKYLETGAYRHFAVARRCMNEQSQI